LSSTPTAAELFFVEIRTDDRANLVAWYAEALGLAVALDDPAGDFTLLTAGPTRLAIQGGRAGTATGSMGLAFRVDDLDAARTRLVERGIAVTGPMESPEGYRAIRCIDPMGHPIQLFQWLVGSAVRTSSRSK
jgi:predicted enzyme related to lactoylglutathione lyase